MISLDTHLNIQVKTVPEAIAWWAAATPDAPVLFGVGGDAVSYAELQSRIEKFARQLAALGIKRGDRVILALPDGVAAAVVGLATICTAVGIPVNPMQSRAEAERVLATVAPRAVIVAQGAETAFRDVATHASIPVVALDSVEFVLLDVDTPVIQTDLPHLPAPDDLAMILLTSGTTDVSRCVPATHGNVLRTCLARVRARCLTHRDRGLSTAPAYFVPLRQVRLVST